LLTDDAVQQLPQLINLSCATAKDDSTSFLLAVNMAVNSLKAGLDCVDDDDSDECKKTWFVEQLQLLEVTTRNTSLSAPS